MIHDQRDSEQESHKKEMLSSSELAHHVGVKMVLTSILSPDCK